MHRIRQPAMQELMANTQEIEWDELSAFTSANSAFAGGVVDLVADESPAVAGDSGAKLHMQLTEREFKALEWSTNIKDRGVLMALCDMMPDAVVEEQVRAYESRPEPQPPCQLKQMIVYPHNLKSRLQVVKAFDEHLRGRGWDGKGRLPYKARAEFEQSLTWSSGGRLKARQKQKALGQWHARWLKGKSLDVLARAPDVARQVGTIKMRCGVALRSGRRRNASGCDRSCTSGGLGRASASTGMPSGGAWIIPKFTNASPGTQLQCSKRKRNIS